MESGTGQRNGKGGRPSSFKSEFVDQARELAEQGATDHEISIALGVDKATLYRWKSKYPQFRDVLKAAKDPADDRVERSLFERAVGYSYPAVKIMQYEGQPIVVDYIEHVPPDTAAAFIWLKNRRREEWRDRHEHTGADGQPLIPPNDPVKLAREVAFVLAKLGKEGG